MRAAAPLLVRDPDRLGRLVRIRPALPQLASSFYEGYEVSGTTERSRVDFVSGGFFGILGVKPALGR